MAVMSERPELGTAVVTPGSFPVLKIKGGE